MFPEQFGEFSHFLETLVDVVEREVDSCLQVSSTTATMTKNSQSHNVTWRDPSRSGGNSSQPVRLVGLTEAGEAQLVSEGHETEGVRSVVPMSFGSLNI